MELRIIFPVLSMLSSGIFHTAVPASLGEDAHGSISARHSRTKRCSCATFLDKECVYFCHLDIIWVNTPERTVSYGLGNAPRKKRSVRDEYRDAETPRCKCADSEDSSCASFCHTLPLRHEAAPDKVIPTADGNECAKKPCKHNLAAKTWRIKRAPKRVDPSAVRATRKTRLLLEKWRLKHTRNAQNRLKKFTKKLRPDERSPHAEGVSRTLQRDAAN